MTQSNFRIAITGGIGSGKSAVCQIIKKQGYPVFSCDSIYSELLTSAEFINKINTEFDGVLNSDGSLNRIALSNKVFNNEAALKKLNSITHPEIMYAAFKKMEGIRLSFLEVPLLFESSAEHLFDGVIVVLRDMEQRINSVMLRDKIDREQVLLRINRQFNYENINFAKYYVIHNHGNFAELEQKTLKILQKINKTKS